MGVIPKAKKPLESLTVLEREKEKSRLRGETEELVDAMGQEDERKAVGVTQEYVKELREQQKQQLLFDVQKLKDFSNNKKHYQRYLTLVLYRHIKEEQVPKGYSIFVESNDQGIVVGLEGTELYAAFAVSGIPKMDLYATKLMAVRIGNTVAVLEGHTRQTKNGILLATEAELDVIKQTWKKPK